MNGESEMPLKFVENWWEIVTARESKRKTHQPKNHFQYIRAKGLQVIKKMENKTYEKM